MSNLLYPTVPLWIHPGLWMLLTALLLLVVKGRYRKAVVVGGPLVALAATALLAMAHYSYGTLTSISIPILDTLELNPMALDRLSFGVVFILVAGAVMLSLFNSNVKTRWEAAAEAAYAGSAIGVVLAGDWITLLVFWEIMAVASWLVVLAPRTRTSRQAGFRYLLVHMFGGNLLLAGVVLLVSGGTLTVDSLTALSGTPAYWLVLIGMGINAAMLPLNAWLVDAYPSTTIGGTTYLGSYTTKVAIYCFIRCFAGTEWLLYMGALMAIFGAAMALLENNLRRLLSYHIISQLGYMVVALALGSQMGIDGAAAHLINNILYKGVLLMVAGSVVAATGKERISDMGGLAKKMPLTAVCCLIASFAIAGLPGFNGFVSKGLIMSAIAEEGFHAIELIMLLASVGTTFSITLKVNYFVFFKKPEKEVVVNPHAVTKGMKIAMVSGAILCVLLGVFPQILQMLTPYGVDGHPYTVDHVTQYIQLVSGASLAFIMYIKKMAPHEGLSLDTDWFYRKPLPWLVNKLSLGTEACFSSVYNVAVKGVAAGSHLLLDTPEKPQKGLEDNDVLQRPVARIVLIPVGIFAFLLLGMALLLH